MGSGSLAGRWDNTPRHEGACLVSGDAIESARVASSSLHWLQLPLDSEALHPPLPTGFACCPPCPGPWDWGLRPPQASFTQGAIRWILYPLDDLACTHLKRSPKVLGRLATTTKRKIPLRIGLVTRFDRWFWEGFGAQLSPTNRPESPK